MAENKKKQPGFEASLTRLEEIVRLLDFLAVQAHLLFEIRFHR